jgi:Flp pilus assembly protein TadD
MRVGGAVLAIAALVAIAMPLSVADSMQSSQAEARSGNLSAALADARNAAKVEPFAAAPRLQEALVLEQGGSLAAAESTAHGATRKSADDWRNWLVLSRIQAERGRAAASLASYRHARALAPRSPLFAEPAQR